MAKKKSKKQVVVEGIDENWLNVTETYGAVERKGTEYPSETAIITKRDTDDIVLQLSIKVALLEIRIDKIINAHESCRNLKGL